MTIAAVKPGSECVWAAGRLKNIHQLAADGGSPLPLQKLAKPITLRTPPPALLQVFAATVQPSNTKPVAHSPSPAGLVAVVISPWFFKILAAASMRPSAT